MTSDKMTSSMWGDAGGGFSEEGTVGLLSEWEEGTRTKLCLETIPVGKSLLCLSQGQ